MQRRDRRLLVLGAQCLGRDVLGQQELQPVEQFRRRRLLLQPGTSRSSKKTPVPPQQILFRSGEWTSTILPIVSRSGT